MKPVSTAANGRNLQFCINLKCAELKLLVAYAEVTESVPSSIWLNEGVKSDTKITIKYLQISSVKYKPKQSMKRNNICSSDLLLFVSNTPLHEVLNNEVIGSIIQPVYFRTRTTTILRVRKKKIHPKLMMKPRQTSGRVIPQPRANMFRSDSTAYV